MMVIVGREEERGERLREEEDEEQGRAALGLGEGAENSVRYSRARWEKSVVDAW